VASMSISPSVQVTFDRMDRIPEGMFGRTLLPQSPSDPAILTKKVEEEAGAYTHPLFGSM